MKISERKKDVPNDLSIINKSAAESKTGNDTIPIIAVTKNAHIVKGSLLIVIPFVLKLITVTT